MFIMGLSLATHAGLSSDVVLGSPTAVSRARATAPLTSLRGGLASGVALTSV